MSVQAVLDTRLASPVRLTLAALTGLAVFVGAWIILPASLWWGWVRNGLDAASWLEVPLGLVAFAIGLVILIVAAVGAGITANLILRQRVAVIGSVFLAVAIFAVMDQAIRGADAWQDTGAGGAEDFTTLADGLFDTHVIALEVLGILLTAAMIGAMVIARPLGVPADETHYATRLSDEDMETLQHVSDVDRNMGGDDK